MIEGSNKDLADLMNRRDQCVDLLSPVVERKRCPRRSRNAETLHQRHRAVMARPDSDPFTVDNGRDVVRVNAFDYERKDRGLVCACEFRELIDTMVNDRLFAE